MKYILALISVGLIQANLMAQKVADANVPDAVKTTFSSALKNKTVSYWEMENGNYEAYYGTSGVEDMMVLTPDGKVVRFEYNATATELPEATRKYITTNCAGQKMGKMTRIKTITGNVSYEVKVGDKDYLFDNNGGFIKIEEEK